MARGVCAIIDEGGHHSVFIFDLDLDVDGDAEIHPNFVIQNSNCSSFCGLNSIMYIFDGLSSHNIDVDGVPRGPRPVGIHTFDLSHSERDLSQIPNTNYYVMDLIKVSPVSYMVAPKVLPFSVRCNQGIVVFSSKILYLREENYYMDESYKKHLAETAPISSDFELFVPEIRKTVMLPQLCIRRRQGRLNPSVFRFYLERQRQSCSSTTSTPERERVLPRSGCKRLIAKELYGSSSFDITNFSVIDDGTTLVVETGFGALFCLDIGLLHQQQPEWQVFHGPVFLDPDHHHNFVTANNELVLSFSGASKFSRGGGSVVRGFPLSSYVSPNFSWRSLTMDVSEFARFPQYVVCILGFMSRMDQAHCTLDVLRLDVSKVEEEEVDQFAQRIKSFKFLGDYHRSDFYPEYCYLFSTVL